MFGAESSPWFDRSFLLTSATTGLGPELARALVSRGARPVAIDRDARALARLATELGGIETLAADTSSPEEALGIARWLADQHPDLGGLISNAGIASGLSEIAMPLAIFGLLGQLRAQGRDAMIAVLLPDAPTSKGVARAARRLWEMRWHLGRGATVTAVLVAHDMAEAGRTARTEAAERTLDAMSARRATLRIAPCSEPARRRHTTFAAPSARGT